MTKYAIGVDFGTLSARALVVEIGTGRELHSATTNICPTAPVSSRTGRFSIRRIIWIA